jgi:gliding motility-associated-like protein
MNLTNYFSMKKLIPFLFGLLLFIGNTNTVKASHIPGGNLTWTCDPNNPLCYTFTFTEFVSCPSTLGSSASGFTITNSCGLTNPSMGTMTQVGVAVDVSQLCATQASSCNGGGGTVPGVLMYTYEQTVCFPADCDSWTIDYNLCCRDANSNTAGGSGNSMHVQSVMNTLTAPCNNGPVVTSQPIPYMCVGQNNTYCVQTTDPDADSTYFQMTAPLGAGGVPIAYNAPYSVNAPMNGFVLDPLTGCMTFNQGTIGNFVVAVLIESYDAAGNLISSIIHDFQFEIINCTNTPPSPPAGGITNFSGTGSQTGPTTIDVCVGDNVCFDVVFNDPNGANILTLTTNGTSILPGATFTQTGTNPATGTFCWNAVTGYSGSVVTFIAEDDACPIVGQASIAVNFNITNGTYAGPDYTICGSQSVQLQATGGTTFSWSPTTGLSNPNIANPIASPAVTTTYTVTSNLTGACPNTDQVTVTVEFPGTLTASAIDTLLCPGDNSQLDALLTLNAPPPPVGCQASTLACSGPSSTYTLGTGTNTTSYPSPYQGFWHDNRVQMIYPAAELLAAGLVAGNISGVSFNVSSKASTQPYNNFYVKIGCTSQTSYASTAYLGGLTTVLGPIAYTSAAGWNSHLFATPYYWDGISSLLVEICWDNTSYTSHDPVFKSTTAYTSVIYDYADGATGCTLNAPASSTLRPNTRFQNCPVTVSPGTFTYTWTPTNNLSNPNIANPTVNGLTTTTTYTVTSFDPNDPTCTVSEDVTIHVNDVDAGADLNICTGGNGQLNAIGTSECTTGGTFSWTPTTGLSNANIANPIASPAANTTYIVGWDDGCSGCIVYDTINVIVTPATPPTMSSVAESCDGLNDGTATATTVGMTAPITYSWNTTPVQTTNPATGLAPGNYTVNVIDANGCTATNNVTVLPGIIVTAGFTPPANQCLTGNSFTFANTGTTGVTYAWDFGDFSGTSTQENPTYTYSAAGTYTVTQTVSSGPCSDVFTANITVYDMPLPTAFADSVLCNGDATGSATVNLPITPGPGPFSYSWNSTPVQITNPATGLPAGTYIVTVTDQTTTCTGQATVTVFEPLALSATEVHVDPSCNGFSDGTATANPTGGTTSYSYSWNTIPVQNTQTATGLAAGTYTCTITDNNGCTTTVNATLADPPGMVLDPTMIAANCGLSDGSANVNVIAGGVGPYTYSWNTTPVQNTQTASNIPAGTYTVTVVDLATGCSEDTIITVTTTAGITATAVFINDALCNGSNDGQAYAFPTGGTAPYTYSWNSTPVQTNDTLTASAGTYTVVITDAAGCTGNDVVTINEPTPVVASITGFNDASCFGANDGDATAGGSGGTAPYTYSWNTTPVQNTQTATGLAPGTYEVIVTDNNGCPDTATVTIIDGPMMTSSIIGSDVTCFGGNDGSANLTPNGGTSPYTYNWTPSGSTAEDPTGLTAGTHYVTITSQEGCSVTDSVVINEPTLLVVVVDSTTDVSCNGFIDGDAYSSTTGGTAPYSFSWNTTPVQNTQDAIGLPFGTYTITVTDANGCIATAIANINEPAPVAATSGSIDAYCGVDQGIVWANPTTGTAPFTFTWDSAAVIIIGNTDTVGGLFPGSYGLLVEDANGCKFNDTVTVIAAPGGTASISSFTDVSCFGGNDGTATVSVGGAFPGFTYQWDAAANNQTTNPATSLSIGTYNVTVTDTLGCVMTTSVTIGEPTALALSVVPGTLSCPGSCDANAYANASGGIGPYSYQWDANALNQITDTAFNLCDGTYSVLITDFNGCTISDSITLSDPDSIVLTTGTIPANCNQADGTAWVQIISGSVGSTTVSWNTVPVQNVDTATNVLAGTYTVTVTDANGCSVSDTATVANLNGPTVTVDSIFNVLCYGGNNGYAEVQVTGGLFPYTYVWDDPSTQTTPSASNLTAGTYTVTITDSNGCVASTAITINEPTQLILTSGGVSPTCFGYTDGSTWVNAFGGVSPYTYSWNTVPVQTTDSINNLPAGSYTVTVVDSNGCFDVATLNLNDPLLFSVNVTGNDVQCFGACDGNAIATLTNGISPFTYAWDDPSLQTTDSIFGLCDDSVNVVVTDAMGCIANGNIVITQPNLLVVTENTHGDVSCNGGNDGFSSVLVTGGTGPYNYLWDLSGNPVSTGQSANNLVAGTYLVTVTDANGCTDNITVVITEPNALAVNATPTDAACFGANSGSAFVSVNGGTTPYTFQWTDPALQQTDTAFNLVAGSYDVTVTDSLGCTFTINGIIINEPTQLVLSTTTISSTCGTNNGSATVNVGGGVNPYTYSWNDPSNQSTATAGSLLAGNYVIVVTDANGCVDSTTANVTDLGSPTVTIPTTTDVSCNGAADGTATASVFGGTTPYTYSWNTTPVQTTITATGLSGQTYSVTVTDSNGCTASASTTIIENSGLSAAITSSTNVSCNGVADGTATVLGAGGGAPYTYSWNSAPVQTTTTASGLPAGTYIVTISDTNACTASDTVIITEPAPLTVTLDSISDVLCNGGSDGYINVIGNGGTLGYSYVWTPNVSAGATAAGISAGNYSVTITDANGCTVTDSYDVFEPAQLVIDTSTISSTCGNPNGSATVSIITGSTPGYTYAWNDPNNQTTATASNLNASTYTVTVTDANGCSATISAIVTDNPGPRIDSITVTSVSCNGGSDGTATVNVTGNGPYTYAWDDPFMQTNQTATGLSASPPLYTVIVTDINGCTSLSVAQIVEPSPLSAFVNAPDTICSGMPVQLFANANGGTLPYSFLWGGGQTGQGPIVVNPITSTTYTVSVLDGSPAGCQASATKTVIVRSPLVVNSNDVTICQGEVAILTATSTGGNQGNGIQYFWMEIDSTTLVLSPTGIANPTNPLNVSPMVTTNYIVWAEDNCSAPDTIGITVFVNDTATAQLVPVKDTCQGVSQDFALTTDIGVSFGWDFDSDGIIDQTTTSTTTSYTYPSSGVYDVTVTITTAQGCVSTITVSGLATVHPNPIADFTTNPNPPIVTLINPTFDFIDQSVGATTWNWNMGDLTFDTVQNPTHTYQDTGYYNVTLYVTNTYGCSDQITKTVLVKPDFFVVVPNSFTPNGNGLNDLFLPGSLVGATERNYGFYIFDRWGELIYEGHDLTDGWNGTVNGGSKIAQIGVYVWVLEVTDLEGNPHRYTGHVNLLK